MSFDVKKTVQEHYGQIATQVDKGSSCCCGNSASCCDGISSDIYNVEQLKDLPREAVQASLGCANPLVFAELKEGEHVLDLGSGGGIDVLMASRFVGPSGKVYGLDMTDEMLALANKNKQRMNVTNVEFIKGFIEAIPLPDESVDAIISNCVINLSDDKEKALSEAFRVLKKGGRVAVADIVALKDVPDAFRKQAEMWCGCLAGTVSPAEYESLLTRAGFTGIEVVPVHVYTKELIVGMTDRKLDPATLEALDGLFAGAHIKARK